LTKYITSQTKKKWNEKNRDTHFVLGSSSDPEIIINAKKNATPTVINKTILKDIQMDRRGGGSAPVMALNFRPFLREESIGKRKQTEKAVEDLIVEREYCHFCEKTFFRDLAIVCQLEIN